MDFEGKVTQLFQEEAEARKMATQLVQIGESSAEIAKTERPALLAFLKGPMEKHMHYEEVAIFPKLEASGFDDEVAVALEHHAAIRDCTGKIEGEPDATLCALFSRIGKLLMQHTNFEQDYLYPELTHVEWEELLEETLH
jgi:iron-sulfur cluster repair protein YtfE (RIC family)